MHPRNTYFAVIGVPGGILHKVFTFATLIFSAKASEMLLRMVGADWQADKRHPNAKMIIMANRLCRIFIVFSRAWRCLFVPAL